MSHLERLLNKLVINIVVVSCILSAIAAALSMAWHVNTDWDNIRIEPKHSDIRNATASFGTYFLLLNTLLPISLAVALEVIKVVQAFYISNDYCMFSWERYETVKCQSASIVEDLGQVGYIFSDKTGTLTRNVMEFKYMQVGKDFYGDKIEF